MEGGAEGFWHGGGALVGHGRRFVCCCWTWLRDDPKLQCDDGWMLRDPPLPSGDDLPLHFLRSRRCSIVGN